MPYIGRDLNRGNYLKLDDISSSFNSSTTTFNLTVGGSAFTPGSAFSILVSVGGVIQEPESAYQVNNSEITFANPPTAQDSFFCIALGVALGIGVPGNGTVNGTQMAKPFNYDGFFYLDDVNNRVGINSSSPKVALDVVGDLNVSGILTASSFSGPVVGSPINNPSGISTFYDLKVTNNLTVEGTTTTLDTNLIGVDRVEVGANSNSVVGVAITQSGTADILRLYDGTSQVVTVDDVGKVGFGTDDPDEALHIQSGSPVIKFSDGVQDSYIKGDNSDLQFIIGGTSKDFKFQTSVLPTSEIVRIGGDGRVGIGTDSPGGAQVRIHTDGLNKILQQWGGNQGSTAGQRFMELYSPSTDSMNDYFRFQTGNAIKFRIDSTNALCINSTGLVGIGTDTPSSLLTIQDLTGGQSLLIEGSAGNDVVVLGTVNGATNRGELLIKEGTTGAAFVRLTSKNSTFNYINGNKLIVGQNFETTQHPDTNLVVKGGITFAENTSATEGSEPAITQWSSNGTAQDLVIGTRSATGKIIFYTNNTGSGGDWGANSNAERVQIDQNGNLQVSTGQFTVGTTATSGLQFINNGTFGTLNSIPLIIRTASAERMRILTDGKVGIGITNSPDVLSIAKAGADDVSLRIIDPTAPTYGAHFSFFENDSSGNNLNEVWIGGVYNNTKRGVIKIFRDATEDAMYIDTNGKVGIGTNVIDGNLHVSNGNAGSVSAAGDANELVLESPANVGMSFLTANDSIARIKFADPDANNIGVIAYKHSDDTLRFNIGGEEHVRFNGGSAKELIRISGPVDSSTQQEFGLGIAVNDAHSHPAAQITLKEYDASDSRGHLLFYTRESNADVSPQERLRIAHDGKVGINTDDPDALLTVAGSGASAQLELKRTNTNASGAIGAVNFTALDGHSVANMYALGDGDNEGAHLIFKTTSAAAENNPYGSGTIERVRIKSDGNVGIGTVSPDQRLEVFDGAIKIDRRDGGGTSYPHLEMRSGNGGSRLMIYAEDATDGNSNWIYKTNSSEEHIFHVGSTERFRIKGNGDVGISSASPTKKLEIQTTGTSGDGILLKAHDSTYPAFMGDANRSATDLFLVAFQGYWNGNRVGEVTVEAGSDTTNKDEGMVKIRTRNDGDSSPQDRLTVYHTGQVEVHSTTDSTLTTNGALKVSGGIGVAKNLICGGQLEVQNNTLVVTSAAPNILMAVPSGGLDSRIYNDGSGKFHIGHGTNSSAPTERITITDSGNVGINETNPTSRLVVEGGVAINNSNLTVDKHIIDGTDDWAGASHQLHHKRSFTNNTWTNYFKFYRSTTSASNNAIGTYAGILHIVYINDRSNTVHTTGYDAYSFIVRARSSGDVEGYVNTGSPLIDLQQVIGSSIDVRFTNASANQIDLQIKVYNVDNGGSEQICHAWIDGGGASSSSSRFLYPSILT